MSALRPPSYCLAINKHSRPEHSPFPNSRCIYFLLQEKNKYIYMCVYVSHCYLGIAGQFFSVSRRVISSTCLRSCAATCSWSFTGEAGNTSKSPPGGFHSQLANPYEPSLFTYVPGCLIKVVVCFDHQLHADLQHTVFIE